jgi:hypothetical protein
MLMLLRQVKSVSVLCVPKRVMNCERLEHAPNRWWGAAG